MKPNSIPVAEQPVIPVGEFLYEVNLRHTRVTEYGFSMQNLMSGQVALPPEGACFDIAFEGTIQGPRLNGTITGVDFSQVRADGRFQLHLHAEITTHDG